MGDERLDNCLSIVANDDNAYKEKMRIAEVAAVTMCRLNSIMKQMKDWQDDRMKLRSNIWRLKLALRVAGRETDDTLHADPLIEHQRAEIKRLEATNKELKKEIADIKAALLDGGYVTQEIPWKSEDKLVEVKQEYLVERERLNNEIRYLKSRLNEVEEGHEHSSEVEHLKCRLKHFMMVDHTMEIIFTDIVNKVAETIANLSEELVNANERLHRSRLRNDSLYVEIDRLKAMLRFKNGNRTDYQMRIVELDKLTKRLKMELNKLKVNYGDNSWTTESNYQNNLMNVEQLTDDLRNKLKNEHEALLAAGDPDCLKYMQKIIELRVSLRQLHVELAKFSRDLRPSCQEKMVESNKHLKQLSNLDSTLEEINIEIDRLKNNHVRKHCRIGGAEGPEYLSKIEELQTIVEKARATMSGFNRRVEGNSNERKDIEELDGFVGKVCYEIKQLEVIVASSDRSSTFKRIEQLEELVVRLKSESNEKDEHANVLGQQLFDTKSLLEQRIKELENAQRKITVLMEENRVSKGRAKKMEEKTLELQRDQEDSRKELEQLQQVKREASVTRKRMQNLQADKEGLLKEMGKIHDVLEKKNEEIKTIRTEKVTMEKAMNAKIIELIKNLQIASKENEKKQNKVNESERAKCKGQETVSVEKEKENAKRSREASETANAELQRLKANLTASNESLNNANREIADLKAKLEYYIDDKTKLEANIFQLNSKKEMLMYQLGAEKSIAEERLKEITELKSNCNELDVERASLEKQKEQLSAELRSLKVEKELLDKSVKHVHAKCSTLKDEIDKCKSERDSLREEIRNFKTSEENLTGKLKEARMELNGAGDKMRRLEFDNSRLRDDLNSLASKNAGFEVRMQMLLSEKNELMTRINELNGKNVALKDQLNEVKTSNEYSSLELNKLRMKCDKTKSENTALQVELDEARNSNEALKEAREELMLKLSEIHSECRILGNQLKILEMMNATLKKERELLEQEYVNSSRSKITKAEKEESVTYSESIFSEQNEQIEHATEKTTNETKRNNAKSGKRVNDKIKKMKEREGLKRLMVENESLKFEILNLRSQNFEIKQQLARMKDELQRQKTELTEKRSNEIAIEPISDKLEIVNLYFKEINSYSDQCSNNVGAVAHIEQSNVYPYDRLTAEQDGGTAEIVNKLKVENVALKMELNSLRCNLVVNFAEDEKRRNELRNATEEVQALKAELTKLRDEKESLRVRLDTAVTKLDRFESEKAALKNELYTLRKINSDLKLKVNELQHDYQKLKERSAGFEGCIMRAIKKIKKYTMSADNQDSSNDELKVLLKKYISSEEVLRSIEQETDIGGT